MIVLVLRLSEGGLDQPQACGLRQRSPSAAHQRGLRGGRTPDPPAAGRHDAGGR